MRPRGAGLAADPDDVPGLNALVLEAWRVRSSRKYDARSASNSEAVGCVARGGDAELFAARAALECRGQLKLPQVWDEPADRADERAEVRPKESRGGSCWSDRRRRSISTDRSNEARKGPSWKASKLIWRRVPMSLEVVDDAGINGRKGGVGSSARGGGGNAKGGKL